MEEMQTSDPINKLGPDYSINPPEFAEFFNICSKRRIAVKTFLLDQSVFSGIGNWMSDEILHLARIHPEQPVNTIPEALAQCLYDGIIDVCSITAETEANTTKFPRHWLMLHRWGKARSKKEVQKTADGKIVDFLTVGGRTGCYIPELQVLFKPEVSDTDDIKSEPQDSKPKRRKVKQERKESKDSKEVKIETEEPLKLSEEQKLSISKFSYKPEPEN
ncbi:hypothetical protein FF38_13389 [Lucilia cuprina]|uniref:Formamidopyrimidine-DNA glycosylase H2TH DNA-binding domain-containing protein n=1 Tax=Lucilia cuprina TaxID=7375 RepID=A0A0L0BXI4_LUCCU|nr:hypothetical protein FF38_13389 [Lucilia cuprina]